MKKIYKDNLRAAKQGRRLWEKLRKQYLKKNKTAIIIMADNEQYNHYVLKHYDSFIAAKKLDGAYILTSTPDIRKVYRDYTDHVLGVIECKEEDIYNMKKFYNLYAFSNQLIWATTEGIMDANESNLIHNVGLTEEEFVCLSLLGLPSIPQ